MSVQFVICGLEHSGTTLVSDLFRQIPNLDSGFEVGILLAKCPGQFINIQPFANNIMEGWGVTQTELESCVNVGTVDEFYRKLTAVSRKLAAGTDLIFDKTPRYLSVLSECLGRTSVNFIATYKDPRAIVHSDFNRSGQENFDAWYVEYLPQKLQYMDRCYAEYVKHKNNPRVEFVSLEELALDARNSMERLFEHVGQSFSIDYVVLQGLKFSNTKSNAVSIPIAFSYFQHFDASVNAQIKNDFSAHDEWFYH